VNFSRNQIIIIGIAGIIVLFFILIFLGVIPGLKKQTGGGLQIGGGQQIELYFWGVKEANPNNAIQTLIDEYTKIAPNIRINYQEFDNVNVYEKTLIDALATFKAPDIFMIHNSWLPKHYNKINPIPENYLSLSYFQQAFPYVAEQDFVNSSSKKIYALPLYIDTLALIYNKDLLDAKAIAVLPTTWSQFQNIIPQLKTFNQFGQIDKSAAAIGGSEKSIHSASDFLSLLMMQFGSQMRDQNGQINFSQEALNALNFYLQFANPSSPYYTWNDNFNYSLDSFAQGSTAIIFDYVTQIPLIKNKNPYLRIGIAPIPQIDNASQPLSYARYWGLSVSNQSKKPDLAWNFILYATANPQASETYLQTAKLPPALKTLIEKYKNDSEIGIFAKQALIARSWPQPDNNAVKYIFSNMIESVLSGRLNPDQALKKAENEINELNGR